MKTVHRMTSWETHECMFQEELSSAQTATWGQKLFSPFITHPCQNCNIPKQEEERQQSDCELALLLSSCSLLLFPDTDLPQTGFPEPAWPTASHRRKKGHSCCSWCGRCRHPGQSVQTHGRKWHPHTCPGGCCSGGLQAWWASDKPEQGRQENQF